jgi:fumarylacetoacetase
VATLIEIKVPDIGGSKDVPLPSTGEVRRFLEDGDEVSLVARAAREGFVGIGFGPCRAVVLAAA